MTRITRSTVFFILAITAIPLGLVCHAASPTTPQPVHITPGAKDNFSVASFYLRVPEKVKKPRYILVLLPGINGEGRGLLNKKQWLTFAEETDAAMLACTFKKEKGKSFGKHNHYAAAQCGSGAALESAIEQFDKQDARHALKGLPLLIYGHSAGGQFAYGFSCHNPKRMIGFAAIKGGYYFPEPIDGTYGVPGLVVSGRKDLQRRRTAIDRLFALHRAKQAPWCWLEDKGGHGAGESFGFVIEYFRELLKLRFKENGRTLRAIPKGAGVTIDLTSKKILGKGVNFEGKNSEVRHAWLPSEKLFKAWAKLDTGQEKYAERKKSPDRK
jgi:hypothetical protein